MDERTDREAPAETPAEAAARRGGEPYLTFADDRGRTQVVTLPSSWERAAIGRSPNLDVVLGWDGQVSNIHAELTRVGDDWLLVDDGLSRNGSWVNDQRLEGRRRLRDADRMRFGETVVTFHAPFQAGQETIVGLEVPDSLRSG